MSRGDKVVVLARKYLRGEIVGFTKDGRIEVDFGWEENWIFDPHELELEQRDDLIWRQ